MEKNNQDSHKYEKSPADRLIDYFTVAKNSLAELSLPASEPVPRYQYIDLARASLQKIQQALKGSDSIKLPFDQTELDSLEQKLSLIEQQNKQAEKIAHQNNDCATVINGWFELLESISPNNQQKIEEAIGAIQKNIKIFLDNIEQLIKFNYFSPEIINYEKDQITRWQKKIEEIKNSLASRKGKTAA